MGAGYAHEQGAFVGVVKQPQELAGDEPIAHDGFAYRPQIVFHRVDWTAVGTRGGGGGRPPAIRSVHLPSSSRSRSWTSKCCGWPVATLRSWSVAVADAAASPRARATCARTKAA